MEEDKFKKYIQVSNEWNFKIDDFDFTCEEITLEEESNFLEFYITSTGNYNMIKLRMVQAIKLKNTPFNTDWINTVFRKFYPKYELKEDEWQNLSLQERLMFIQKLENSFLTKIIQEIAKYYINKEEQIKN